MNHKLLMEDEPQRARLSISLLGRFQVRVADEWIESERWTLRKARQLLMLLALAPNHRLHREQIFDLLWPDFCPAAADNNFRRTLHETRRTLAPAPTPFDAYVRLEGPDVGLVEDSLWVDVTAFTTAAERAREKPTPEAFGQAISLYGGDLVPEERYNEWMGARRERLQSEFLALWFELAELHESRNEPLQAIQAYREVLDVDPTHEDVHTRLMRLYGRTGQRHLALRQYRMLQDVLHRELDVEPAPPSRLLYEQLVRGQPDDSSADGARNEFTVSPAAGHRARRAPVAPPERAHNFPTPLTPFIRDSDELETAIHLLASNRLVTLTGTGGSGKSRFALEVGHRVAHEYKDGAALVDLSEITDPASARDVIAAAFGVATSPNEGALDNANSSKHQLIILDNCEHLVELCQDLVGRLLPLHPRTHLLVTSRRVLGVSGEVAWPLPALSIPDAHCELPPEELLDEYSAIALFAQYAVRTKPDFQLTGQNAEAVISICRQLDGNPLALKLAAARIHMLSPAQIAALLNDPFPLLKSDDADGPPRHRTLRATFDWSYNLLTPELQRIFQRLSMLEGEFTLEAAVAVIGDDLDNRGPGSRFAEDEVAGGHIPVSDHLLLSTLNRLSSLAAQSLIVAKPHAEGTIRYRMPTILRQYAHCRLREGGGESVFVSDTCCNGPSATNRAADARRSGRPARHD